MELVIDASGIDTLRARLAEARARLPGLMQQAVRDAGKWVAQNLSDAAPVGEQDGSPPQGDAPGKLAESFYMQDESSQFDGGAAVSVRTRQPQKLEYVRFGTGLYGPRKSRIYPRTKRALYWPGAAHPVKSVAGQQPNDFVTPTLEDAPTAEDALSVVADQLIAILEG